MLEIQTMKKLVISAFAASLVMGGASLAYADQTSTQTRNTASAYGVGTASANRDGAQAGAVVAGKATQSQQSKSKNRKHRHDQQPSAGASTSPNAASTYTTGAVYTDRNRATASGSTGGTAAGTGVQSTTSGLSVYGDVYKDGGSAGVEGGSTAESGQRPARRPQ